jgi:hemin uptake protein HemP
MNGSDGRRGPGRAAGHANSAVVRVGPDGVRRVDAADLLGGAREVLVLHAGQAYCLRVTASGKLILTK